MKKKASKSASPAPVVVTPPTPSRSTWNPWKLGVLAILLLAGAGAAWMYFTDPAAPPGPAPEGMVWVPPGEFWMGNEFFPDASPVHRVAVDGFWMDRTEVTNEQFAAFVKATGYVTVAERTPKPTDFPMEIRHQLTNLVPCAVVFSAPKSCTLEECRDCNRWWKLVEGANWKHPKGPGSSIEGLEKHPVVHMTYEDAVAYAEWAGKRLPTEAEWERAARGNIQRKDFYWGTELKPGGKWLANVWQGAFPCENTAEDGFAESSPVASFPPNDFGLYDMAGNAWEWTNDWYQHGFQVEGDEVQRNPTGPKYSVDPDGRGESKRVVRGGSFMCSDRYCVRYRSGGRMSSEVRTPLQHTGFRCVKSAK